MIALRNVGQKARDAIARRRRPPRAALPRRVPPVRAADDTKARAACRARCETRSPAASSRKRSRFSAKFSRALGKKRAPGMRSASRSTGPAPQSARTSAKRASSCQNSAGCSMDQAYSSVVVARAADLAARSRIHEARQVRIGDAGSGRAPDLRHACDRAYKRLVVRVPSRPPAWSS